LGRSGLRERYLYPGPGRFIAARQPGHRGRPEKQRLDIEGVDFIRADFDKDELQLEELDGILIANALHYVVDKAALITRLERMFSGEPCFIIIEYETDRRNPWVPYPIPFEKLKLLFVLLGYRSVLKINERQSAYRSGNMYCALIQK
jgi:ubiquinone/menaquinone biosynthesis C-methylase UbiE